MFSSTLSGSKTENALSQFVDLDLVDPLMLMGAVGVDGRGQGSESSQTQLAGFEGPAPAQPNPNHPAPIMLPRLGGRDADQGPNARQLGDGVGSVVRDSRQLSNVGAGREGGSQRPTGNQKGAGGRRRPGGPPQGGDRAQCAQVG